MERADGLALLHQRCASVPAALGAMLRGAPSWPALPRGPVIATGIGGSEGAARLLASRRQRQGLPARFVPLSAFLDDPPEGAALVLFSQGLCPNAALALAHASRFADARLVTALPAHHEALRPFPAVGLCPLPAGDEAGLLVRVVGPALASLAALLLLEEPSRPSPEAFEQALAAAASTLRPEPLGPGLLALVTAGAGVEAYEGARWRLLEGLLRPDVQLWDALALAHGPFQAFHGAAATLLALEAPGALSPALTARLGAMLRPERHRLRRLAASLPCPWSLFEHTLMLDTLMLATLEAHPRPLAPWPGQGEDGPLYQLGPETCPG